MASVPEAFAPHVVTLIAAESAEESGISRDPRVAPTPTAAVATAACLIKFLLFADSIVDSGHTVDESLIIPKMQTVETS